MKWGILLSNLKSLLFQSFNLKKKIHSQQHIIPLWTNCDVIAKYEQKTCALEKWMEHYRVVNKRENKGCISLHMALESKEMYSYL